ncbi:MAG: low temperature requirement protein A, partial [Candidatus Promineifilaceae bacterium]|nr:low temperature requirement protein A [Candidatus Promineifilaceae bacterium]
WSQTLIIMAVLAVVVTCALWWSYFPKTKPVLDRAMEISHGIRQTQSARDVYSLLHFPMILGIIAFAFAVGEGVAHPADLLETTGRIAQAAGLLLFVGGMATAI